MLQELSRGGRGIRAVQMFGLWLAGLLSVACAGCLITDDIEFPDSVGVIDVGSCMCATCWDRPFCWSRELNEATDPLPGGACPDIVRDGPACSGGQTCADGTCTDCLAFMTVPAVEASRLREVLLARESFFCIPPDGKNVNFADEMCPADDEERQQFEFVDPCHDVPRPCRDPGDAMFDGCAERRLPDDPLCLPGTPLGHRRTGCSDFMGEGDTEQQAHARARDKLLRMCAVYGDRDPPSGSEPERFCFLSCVQEGVVGEWTPGFVCAESMFDPPEVTGASFMWRLAGSGSYAIVEVDGEAAHVPLDGTVALHAPGCAPGVPCAVRLPWIALHNIDPFTLAGKTASSVVVLNPEPISHGDMAVVSAGVSRFTLADGSVLYVTGDISDAEGRRGDAFTSPDPMLGELNWSARTFSVEGYFTDTSGRASIYLYIEGELPNLRPVADAGADVFAECTGPSGTLVTLSGADTYDPDDNPQIGYSDIRSYDWSFEPSPQAPGSAWEGQGRDVQVLSPLGIRRYTLTATDRESSMSSDNVAVNVMDTVPPIFDQSLLPGQCIPWDKKLRLFTAADLAPAFMDQCDPAVDLFIASIWSDVPSDPSTLNPDFKHGASNFCLRGEREPPGWGIRTYVVRVIATDASGNGWSHYVSVRVDKSTSCGFGPMWVLPAVANGDARCVE